MSTRTIIEINHDYMHELGRTSDEWLPLLIRSLSSSTTTGVLNREGPHSFVSGLRILGQRHHSEPEWKQGKR